MLVVIQIAAEILSIVCLLIGSFLCLSGGVGILRFPDFYTRVHAVGVSETLAAAMILMGLILRSPDLVVVLKLTMIFALSYLVNPAASHALVKAAIRNGLLPLVDEERTKPKRVEQKTITKIK